MDGPEQGAADGTVGVDQLWRRKLSRLMAATPVPPTLLDAVRTLPDVEQDDLQCVIEGKREEWGDLLYGAFGLPREYPLDYAIAIYVYTLDDPKVYAVVNRVMFNPARRRPGGSGVSEELKACMPYIKFLDASLEALPASFLYSGQVRRGVQWVYPSPDRHDPDSHFPVGSMLLWYEFKSTSKEMEVMTRPHFCGVTAGPRTIFVVQARHGYDISRFSYFQGVDSEHEVLFRPLSQFRVQYVQKNIIDPKETASLQKSGFPDSVGLLQVEDGKEGAGKAEAAQEGAAAKAAKEVAERTAAEAKLRAAVGARDIQAIEGALKEAQDKGVPADKLMHAVLTLSELEKEKETAAEEAAKETAAAMVQTPTAAALDSFCRKVGCSMERMRTAQTIGWSCKRIDSSDCDVIAYLISSGALPQLVKLRLTYNKIGNSGLTSLSEALASGALPQLKVLHLRNNQIGNAGFTSFSDVLASGALTQLKILWLRGNNIGDAGLTSFSEALASGALPSLERVFVHFEHEEHPQLVAACNPRGIEIA